MLRGWLGVCWGLLIVGLIVNLTACTGHRAVSPKTPEDRLAQDFARAAETEQIGRDEEALNAYLDLIDAGLAAGRPGFAAAAAGLDALVGRTVVGLDRVTPSHALVFRTPGALPLTRKRLARAYDRSSALFPWTRSLVARALADLARFEGDAAAAASWRTRTGAVSSATLIGPLRWTSLQGVEVPTAMEKPGAALRSAYPGVAPFAAALTPLVAPADDGVLDVADVNPQSGVYAVVVDVEVPRSGRLWVALQSTAAANVVVGGQISVTRPYALGGGAVMRFGSAEVPAGRCRVVVRLGVNDDGGRFALWLLGDDGSPLAVTAPTPGQSAPVVAHRGEPWELTTPGPRGRELFAAAQLSLGHGRSARRVLEAVATRSDAPPLTALLFARAVERSDDVPEVRRAERARTGYERALAGWPSSWEARLGTAVYGSARKGPGEGRLQMLQELARRREGSSAADPPLVRALEAVTAAEVGVRDVADQAYESIRRPLGGTSLLLAVERRVHPRTGAEAEQIACTAPERDRNGLDCFQQRLLRGKTAEAQEEITRLRSLRGNPRGLWPQELQRALAEGNPPGLLALYDALLPGQRPLALLTAATALPADVRRRWQRDVFTARDAPAQIPVLLRLLGDDPASSLEVAAEQAVREDRQRGAASGVAATLVLLHQERYDLDAQGLLHSLVQDVRRVSGTTDVEQGVGGVSFVVVGRDVRRTLRRRIHKRDGRILEPDRANLASQGNADLSQLEPGDAIEQIIEGWSLPNRAGHLVVNTPDLLPERTGVVQATVELRLPRGLDLRRWAHPRLGRPQERDEGEVHVVRYRLASAAPRRLEEGVPRTDQDVAVSFGTYLWADVAAHLDEQIRAGRDNDPLVTQWANEVVNGVRKVLGTTSPATRAVVERLVIAAGQAVRVSNGSMFSDLNASLTTGSQSQKSQTAQQVLDLGQGSRTLLLFQAFKVLGLPVDLVVAEREPFSSDPTYPARPNRFDHPLLVVHLPAAEGGDQWIDADVEGPPLPVGRVSPDLVGRTALTTTGTFVVVPEPRGEAQESLGDAVEIRLRVDEKGDATGTFAVSLRGRPSQGLADALERVVGSERRDLLRNVVLGWLPWANVEDVTLSSEDGAWSVGVRARVTIPGYAIREGATWILPGLEPLHTVFPRAFATTLSAVYSTQLERQSALAVATAYHYRVRREVELPATAQLRSAAAAVQVRHERLQASRQSTLTNHLLQEQFALDLTIGTIATYGYRSFARETKRVDDGFLAGTRVVLK